MCLCQLTNLFVSFAQWELAEARTLERDHVFSRRASIPEQPLSIQLLQSVHFACEGGDDVFTAFPAECCLDGGSRRRLSEARSERNDTVRIRGELELALGRQLPCQLTYCRIVFCPLRLLHENQRLQIDDGEPVRLVRLVAGKELFQGALGHAWRAREEIAANAPVSLVRELEMTRPPGRRASGCRGAPLGGSALPSKREPRAHVHRPRVIPSISNRRPCS